MVTRPALIKHTVVDLYLHLESQAIEGVRGSEGEDREREREAESEKEILTIEAKLRKNIYNSSCAVVVAAAAPCQQAPTSCKKLDAIV